MHPDIEKLLSIAKENGDLTEKQREIILRKAEKLGEDLDEVEMILESLSISSKKEIRNSPENRRKCPNCGAIISDNTLTCPECGYVFGKESNAGYAMQDYVSELKKQLSEIDSKVDIDSSDKDVLKASIINTFTVPTTKESLIQLFTYSYSNYISTKEMEESVLGAAWLGRAKNAYLLLKSQPSIDQATRALLNNYAFIESTSFKQKRSPENSWWLWIMMTIIAVAICFMVVFSE